MSWSKCLFSKGRGREGGWAFSESKLREFIIIYTLCYVLVLFNLSNNKS